MSVLSRESVGTEVLQAWDVRGDAEELAKSRHDGRVETKTRGQMEGG